MILRPAGLHVAMVLFAVDTATAQIGAALPPSAAGHASSSGSTALADAQTAGEKTVEQGLFPKSIKIPGTDLSLAIGGYVKLDFIEDFSAIGDPFEFKTSTIPARGSAAAAQSGLTTLHARETRFNFDIRTDTPSGRFRAFVEGDFFGSGNAFRLRHGFGEFGHLLAGQTWTTFMDISARPFSLDFEGPDGEVFVRQAMVRWTHRLAEHWTWAIAAESPTPQFAVPSALVGAPRSNIPDIPAFVRYEQSRGHVQLAAVLRQLRFDGGEGSSNATAAGVGLNATFTLKVLGGDLVQGQFVIGDGTARYIEALSGQNLDAVLSSSGDLSGLRSQAGMVAYTHHWRSDVRSVGAYSTASVAGNPNLSGGAVQRTQDVRANVIWTPFRLVDIGGELLWGRRANQDGTRGDAWRFQFSMLYRLN